MMAGLGKARVLSIALLLLTFAAGVLAGVAWRGNRPASPPAEEESAEEQSDRDGRRLVIDEVGLEPAKRAEVDEIVRHYRATMRALNDEFDAAFEPRRRGLVRATLDSIRSILSPEQLATYDSLRANRVRGRNENSDSAGDRDRGRSDRRPNR
ncbi:MAG: hypothetical protein OXE96_13025 [Gemmatimonadetes bacterium]|nr:hypothetical protein [Gemmatimonadota bacterium]